VPTSQLGNPVEEFLTTLVANQWDGSRVQGYDPTASPGTDAYLPMKESLDKEDTPYPYVIIQNNGSESVANASGYSFLTTQGAGQSPSGELTVQVEADDGGGPYTGDGDTYSGVSADEIVELVREELSRICFENPTGGSSEFSVVSSFRNEVPDQRGSTNVVRTAGSTIQYDYIRER